VAKFSSKSGIRDPDIYTGIPDPGNFWPPRVVWAREQGWLNVRDPGDGSWHSIQAKDAPSGWIELAKQAHR